VLQQVQTRQDFLDALNTFQPDLILSDYQLPGFDGLTALKLAQEHAQLTPFIIWTGAMGEDVAVECMRAGAVNYILKENIKRLGSAVVHALEERRLLLEHQRAAELIENNEKRFRALIENGLDNISLLAADGTLLWESPSTTRTLGYAQNEFLGQDIFQLIHPEDFDWTSQLFAKLVQAPGSREQGVFRLRHQDGTWRWTEAVVTNLLHEPSVEAIVINYRDITARKRAEENLHTLNRELERRVAESTSELRLANEQLEIELLIQKQAQEALRQSEEKFRLVSWATTDAVWDWDLETNQIQWGAGLQKVFHYDSEVTQTDVEWWHDHIHPEDRDKVMRSLDKALEGGMEFWSKEYRFRRADGSYATIMDRGYILQNDKGKPNRMIGAMLDISDRKQDEETIRHQNEMLSGLHYITLNLLRYREVPQLLSALVEFSTAYLDASYAEIMLPDGETLVVKAVTQDRSRLLGQRLGRKDAPLSWQAFDTQEPAVLSDYASWPQRQEVYDEFSFHAVAVFPILNDDQCLGVLAVGREKPDYDFTHDQVQFGRFFADLTALVLINAQLRESLHEQTIRDPLTGLFNRRYMDETLKRELSRATRQLHPLGIIMIDLDRFKHFNDTHGHGSGDALLQQLGQFLQSHIRGEDIACRYGGEEFLLIMPNASLEAAQQRAEYLRREAKKLQVPGGSQSYDGITLSLGVAIYPEHGHTMETVLRAADAALYRAKQEGRDRVVIAEKES
jgi:diguanylate cyclase (GGDEF)-like protein/PAS domain S-box-containing protein